jgi:hypothetical protein
MNCVKIDVEEIYPAKATKDDDSFLKRYERGSNWKKQWLEKRIKKINKNEEIK